MKLILCYPLNLPFTISQKFGGNQDFYKQYGLIGHNGWDLSVPNGTDVYATHDGEITYAGLDGANGVIVVMKTLQEYDYNEGKSFYKTHYGHLKSGSVIVTVGQKVKKGEKIAESNNTGASSGPHVHFGIKPIMKGEADWQWFNLEQDKGYNGAIDPAPYFDGSLPIVKDSTKFLAMQQAILDFQVSEGILDFVGKPLSSVKLGDKTKEKIKKYE